MATRKADRKTKPAIKSDLVDETDTEATDAATDNDSTAALGRRMNRIQGQVVGIGKMIDDQRTCVDILNQISAVKSALDGVAMAVLERQAYQCFPQPLTDDDGKRSLQEFIDMVRKYAR